MNPQALSLTVPARAENLAVVRQALAGYAQAMGFDSDSIADLKTVVTEACMNVVIHAYPDGETGPLEVSAQPDDDGLEIAVRDYGSGFRPRPAEPEAPGLRLGLPLIATLSDQFEIRGGEVGTEVRMILRFAQNGPEPEGAQRIDVGSAQGTAMSIAAGAFVRPVLARVIGALAARADFTVDRLSDTVLIGDAVSAHDAADFRDGTVGIEIVDGQGRLDVRIGPLVDGAGERILDGLELPGGMSLRTLASEINVQQARDEPDGEPAEYLVVGIDR
ncbi:MAG TPA: ATP-binding protein [Solirubrobacterales bacterium]|nr:ATP-binding protein [Solirubrobacterales bacterium]